MKRVVFNQKGGVGKTSITCNLAAIGASMGYRTLVIDLDVQGNTTHYLVGEIDAEAYPAEAQGVAALFKQTVGSRKMAKNPDSFVWDTPYENLFLMPSSPVLSEMEKEGANPFKDPMAITAIVGITVPFVILGIAGALGYIGQ